LSKRLIVLLAGIVAVAAAIAGCGSSDDSSTHSTTALTKAEFIKQGDAICEKGGTQIEEEAESFADENDVDTENPTDEQQEEVIEEVVAPSLRTQADELTALGAPKGEEEQVSAVIDALEEGAGELETDPGALLTSKGAGPLDKANELANEFGFKACGQE
jgi:hypothetical protein